MTVDDLTHRTTPPMPPRPATHPRPAPPAPVTAPLYVSPRLVPRIRRLGYEPPFAGYEPAVEVGASPARPVSIPDSVIADLVTADLPDSPEARAAAARILRLVVEILSRRRPVTQLAAHADPRVLRYLRVAVPARGAVTLTSLRVCQPHRLAAETTAICRFGPRYRAITARLQIHPDGGWTCTALRIL